MYKRYVLICESGWRRIRELSLDLANKSIPSTVLIEGLVDRQIRTMITRHKGIDSIFIPEKLFAPFLFIYLTLALIIFPKAAFSIYISKERTYNRLTLFKKLFPRIELVKAYDKQ